MNVRRSGAVVGLVVLSVLFLAPGSSQADTYYCFGRPATWVGTEGPDTFTPTTQTGDNVIVTLGGNDYVAAGGGDDLICSGAGNDAVNGMQGDDRVHGGWGVDRVEGGLDSDVLYGDAGNDTMPESLRDRDTDTNILHGGRGDDRMIGGDSSANRLYGDAGDDYLVGLSPGNFDALYGGAGADQLDTRDFSQEDGQPPPTPGPDLADGGTDLLGSVDQCLVDGVDTYRNCEQVTVGWP
jgi:Ca2+-binding RTX toxin-like protein